jgi:quercetin dioxygenase-like cupin family protein
MKMVAFALVLSMGMAGAASAEEKHPMAADKGHVMVSPKDLAWTDAPPGLPKGAKVAVLEGDLKEGPWTVRLQMPAKYRIMPHTHPTIEHVTVLSGSLNMGMAEKVDEKASTKLGVGAFAAMPANTAHYVWTTEKAVVQVHGVGPFAINYIDPKDDPRNAAPSPAANK